MRPTIGVKPYNKKTRLNMTPEQFNSIITDVADTTGHTETVIYDYLWSLIRHPITPASITRYLTGSNAALGGADLSDAYRDKLSKLMKERGHFAE